MRDWQVVKEMQRKGRSSREIHERLDELLMEDLEKYLRDEARWVRRQAFRESLLAFPFYLLELVVYIPVRLIRAVGDAVATARGES